MIRASAKSSTYSFILKDHVFCDVLNMFIHLTMLNNTQLSLYLNLPTEQIEQLRSGRLFGIVDKTICSKLDQLFETKSGFFYEVMKRTLIAR